MPLRFVRHDGNESPAFAATFHEDSKKYKDIDGNKNSFNKRDWVVEFRADCYDGNTLEEIMHGEELDDSPIVTVMKWGGRIDVQGRVSENEDDDEEGEDEEEDEECVILVVSALARTAVFTSPTGETTGLSSGRWWRVGSR